MKISRSIFLALVISTSFCFAQDEPNASPVMSELRAVKQLVLGAKSSEEQTIVIGAKDPNTEDPQTGFKLQLILSSRGASLKEAVFSNGQNKGFDDRDPEHPMPLVLLKPVQKNNGGEIFSMASNEFIFVDQKLQLKLNQLNWDCLGVETTPNGCEKATFTAVINNQETSEPLIRLTKTYALSHGSYTAFCNMTVENLSNDPQSVRFNLTGPVGISREDARTDIRKVVSAFKDAKGQLVSSLIDLKKFKKAKTDEDLLLKNNSNKLLWTGIVNKYFTAIAVPLTQDSNQDSWVGGTYARFYNPDEADNPKFNSGDEALGFDIKTKAYTLASAGSDGSMKKYNMELYLGPKDKKLFDKNDYYKQLGFYMTMDFITCCCPAAIIQPLTFLIIWTMNFIYTGVPNYGIVIIILVFLVRLILHPITKMGQVRMSRFTKIMSSPEVLEIKKKYGKNQMEMQKQISAFYKERGISPLEPIIGMIPMMAQMPIWIAVWSAVNASIDLRGAAFLPFWITDLSSPDALFRFPEFSIPLLSSLLGKISSFNLLPILMGVAFYLQQKLTPMQAAATPEQAQQQKIMMIMLPVMFPLMLYSGPSGVNLYIMASTFGGAIEQYVIKKHIKEKEEAEKQTLIDVTAKTGGKLKKKKPKPFFKQFS